MSSSEMRKRLHELIDQMDDKALKIAYTSLVEEGDTVALTPDGKPVSIESYRQEVLRISRMEEGWVDQDDIEKASDIW